MKKQCDFYVPRLISLCKLWIGCSFLFVERQWDNEKNFWEKVFLVTAFDEMGVKSNGLFGVALKLSNWLSEELSNWLSEVANLFCDIPVVYCQADNKHLNLCPWFVSSISSSNSNILWAVWKQLLDERKRILYKGTRGISWLPTLLNSSCIIDSYLSRICFHLCCIDVCIWDTNMTW